MHKNFKITIFLLYFLKLSVFGVNKKLLDVLVKKWAPLVWLAPGEKFMPLSVHEFLDNVHTENFPFKENRLTKFLRKTNSENNENLERSYLVTNVEIDELLNNSKSFLYGKDPSKFTVPIYANVKLCNISEIQNEQKTSYIPIEFNDDENSIFAKNDIKYYKSVKHKRSTTEFTQNRNNFMANIAHNIKFSNNYDESDMLETIKRKVDMQLPSFHVTYWMFYPYSQGKTICTINLGLFGRIPIPLVFNRCIGSHKDIGNHVGDWEHMSLFFSGSYEPKMMYVSAHDAGAYYSYNNLTGTFEFESQETRKGLLQKPKFPKTVITTLNHPILFAALGSHGLWTAPGKHRFVRVARLYDINGFGTPWSTWKAINIFYENFDFKETEIPQWFHFKGKWGNPKSKCHPLKRIGLNFCEYTDGPSGIFSKKSHFQCN